MGLTTIQYAARLARFRGLVATEFAQTFGISLKPYWSNIEGFDVVKFDDVLKPPDGTSSMDACAAGYGERAVRLIEQLIAAPLAAFEGEVSPAPEGAACPSCGRAPLLIITAGPRTLCETCQLPENRTDHEGETHAG